MDRDLHQRLLRLKDLSLGLRPPGTLPPAGVSYDSVVDSLLALHAECSQESLAKDKNIARFVTRYKETVSSLKGLRLSAGDFQVLSIIGRGHFGEVQVVSEKSTGDVYAMKIMKKSNILQQADAAFFIEERDIMAWASSQWLTRLHFAFHDSTSLYLVMDYHPGGDLLTVMERREGGMTEEHARFYLSEIAMGLNDLHQLGFLHRDVKPENVLIARSGHIKLVDFGSAARLAPDGKVVQCRLPVGTPEYIAPEVLMTLDKSADYGVGCDWWSLGIIAYELIYDTTPFEDDSTAKTYANIMNYKSFSLPEEEKEGEGGEQLSGSLRALIVGLLTTPDQRLGFTAITTHSFFAGTDWDNLTAVQPPYVPVVSGESDASNFESFEPEKEYSLRTSSYQRPGAGFSGKDLPFVGFTFSPQQPSSSSSPPPPAAATVEDHSTSSTSRAGRQDVDSVEAELEETRKELAASREKKGSLERECAIYQSQLEDYHRKLEIERSECRHSDSQALQLLQEVRQQSRVVQELREKEASLTQGQMSGVVQQLETDRSEASRRARRLQEELKATGREREEGAKKMAELSSQLAQAKKQRRKDITTLQEKLTKVTQDSLAKAAGLQDRLIEAHEKYSQAVAQLTEEESARKKAVFELDQMKLLTPSGNAASDDLNRKLAETGLERGEAKARVAQLEEELKTQSRASEGHQQHCSTLKEQLSEVEGQLQEASGRCQELESNGGSLRGELGEVGRELAELRGEHSRLQASSQRAREELLSKTQQFSKHEESVSKLMVAKQYLESKLTELERLREAVDTQPVDENFKALGEKISSLEGEKQRVEGELASLRSQLEERGSALEQARTELGEAGRRHEEVCGALKAELRGVKSQLSAATSTGLDLGERLREVRRVKRELSQELATMHTSSSKTEAELSSAEERCQRLKEELKAAAELKEKLASFERDAKLLEDRKKEFQREVAASQREREELGGAKREAQAALDDAKNTIEAQELNAGLLQRSVEGLEEEVQEQKQAVEDAQKQEAHWKAIKEAIANDLEMAEERLDNVYTTADKETNSRIAAEKRLEELVSSLEKTTETHSQEVQELQALLSTQKQLASRFSDQVAELEQGSRLKELALKEVQQELLVEKTVSSKLYDELQSVRQEHGKTKAAKLKLASEVSHKQSRLTQAAETVEEQRTAAQTHQLQETRLQATISQQSKLIDFLQTRKQGGTTPGKSTPGSRLRKGLKLGRKSRDPMKEIAEWNKLKGLLTKSSKQGRVPKSSSSSSVQMTPSSSSDQQRSQASTAGGTGSGGTGSGAREGAVQLFGVGSSLAVVDDQDMELGGSVVVPAEAEGGGEEEEGEGGGGRTVTVVAGRKRSAAELNTAPGDAKRQGERVVSHNIPHQFRLKTNPFHKSYTCSYCQASIKQRSKFSKCHYCGLICHQHCVESVPNSCGLPLELAEHVHADQQQPSPKKARTTTTTAGEKKINKSPLKKPGGQKPSGKASDTDTHDGGRTPTGESSKRKPLKEKMAGLATPQLIISQTSGTETPPGAGVDRGSLKRSKRNETVEGAMRQPPPAAVVKKLVAVAGRDADRENVDGGQISVGFDGSRVVKSGRISTSKDTLKVEGWLVLTEKTLYFYNRDPKRGVRPLHTHPLSDPGMTTIVLANTDRELISLPSPSKLTPLALTIEQHCSTGYSRSTFFTTSVREKNEWAKEIQSVLSTVEMQQSPRTRSKIRELKSVSIVPIRRFSGGGGVQSPMKGGAASGRRSGGPFLPSPFGNSTGLDLSFSSSVLEGGDSDSSSMV